MVNADLWCLSFSVHSLSFRNITSLKLDLMDHLRMENTTITPCAAFPSLYTTMFLAEAAVSSRRLVRRNTWVEKSVRTPTEIQDHCEQTLVPVEFSTLINIYQLRMSIMHSRNPCVGSLSIIRAVLCKLLLLPCLISLLREEYGKKKS